MAYRVEYASKEKKLPDSGASGPRIVLLSAAFFAVFCLFVCTFWPQGQEVLAHFLFPGGVKPAMAAAEIFTEELRNGEPIADALEHFCREILADAHLP